MAPDFRDGGGDGAVGGPVGGPEPALRGGGLPLPGLKHWRLRKGGMSQADLALRAGLTADYLFKVESGRRGCNPEAAEELAEILEVDLRELRTMRDDPGQERASSAPARPRVAHRRVHQAYLRILLIALRSHPRASRENTRAGCCQSGKNRPVNDGVRCERVIVTPPRWCAAQP